MKLPSKLCCCVLFFLLTACRVHMSDLPVITDRDINTKDLKIERLEQHKEIVGISRRTLLFCAIPLGLPSMKQALDNALDSVDGDLMLNASIDKTSWCAVLFGRVGYEIKGTVVNTKKRNKK